VGREAEVAEERAAIQRLAGDARVPTLLGEDRDHDGNIRLVLTPPRGPALIDRAASLDLPAIARVVSDALSLAERLEREGLGFLPESDDFFLDETGTLHVARLRGAARMRAGDRLDPEPVFAALGRVLLPLPAGRGPLALVRLLLGDAHVRTLDDAQAELASAIADLSEGVDDDSFAVSDRGMRRDQNEDAFAIAHIEDGAVLVVCDGVSSSVSPERASRIASLATRDALIDRLVLGKSASDAMFEAVLHAHAAIGERVPTTDDEEPPGTTLVAALVQGRRLVIGWVGDSRAYWITQHSAELLTHDHSWVNEVVARGELSETEALASPFAHALTSCLGPRSVGDEMTIVEPSIIERELVEPGTLVLCSDGLWNYFERAEDVARAIAELPEPRTPRSIARWLGNQALIQGGHDNVTVAVLLAP